jgi:NTP pyrophosphatase (non-canonical NTP hydrolase)
MTEDRIVLAVPNKTRGDILHEVNQERNRQDAKWGKPMGENLFRLLAVLMEEVGELSAASLSYTFDGDHGVKREAIQVAAVAVKIVEALGEGK